MPPPLEPHEIPPTSDFVKRGILIGAALGMLAGLLFLWAGMRPPDEVDAIKQWRNWILAGAALGLLLGLATGLFVNSRSRSREP